MTKVHQPMGVVACTQPYHLGRLVVIDTCFALIRALTVQKSDGCSMKMSPNEGESTVHSCHGFPSDLPVLMRVVYWPDCGLVCVSLVYLPRSLNRKQPSQIFFFVVVVVTFISISAS